MIKTNKNKKIIFIIFSIYLFALFFEIFFLNTGYYNNKLMHIDSKVIGSRWVYYKSN